MSQGAHGYFFDAVLRAVSLPKGPLRAPRSTTDGQQPNARVPTQECATVSSSHHTAKTCLAAALALLTLLSSSPAALAAPPLTTRGIDLANVLLMREHARSQDWMRGKKTRRKGRRLKHIKTIVIDPGHGGENQGALGVASIHEKFLTINLAYDLRDAVQAAYPDARVILTRYWDRGMSLSERIHMANTIEADLFISLHYNSAVHDKAHGVETFFLSADQVTPGEETKTSAPIASTAANTTGMPPEDKRPEQGTFNDTMLNLQRDLQRARQHRESGLLAEAVQDRLTRHTDARDRGVKQANFGVLRGALMPAIVVEGGFLSHPEEGKEIPTSKHRKQLITALTRSIYDFDVVLRRRDARPKAKTPAGETAKPALPPIRPDLDTPAASK